MPLHVRTTQLCWDQDKGIKLRNIIWLQSLFCLSSQQFWISANLPYWTETESQASMSSKQILSLNARMWSSLKQDMTWWIFMTWPGQWPYTLTKSLLKLCHLIQCIRCLVAGCRSQFPAWGPHQPGIAGPSARVKNLLGCLGWFGAISFKIRMFAQLLQSSSIHGNHACIMWDHVSVNPVIFQGCTTFLPQYPTKIDILSKILRIHVPGHAALGGTSSSNPWCSEGSCMPIGTIPMNASITSFKKIVLEIQIYYVVIMSSKKMHMDAIDTLLYRPYKLEKLQDDTRCHCSDQIAPALDTSRCVAGSVKYNGQKWATVQQRSLLARGCWNCERSGSNKSHAGSYWQQRWFYTQRHPYMHTVYSIRHYNIRSLYKIIPLLEDFISIPSSSFIIQRNFNKIR